MITRFKDYLAKTNLAKKPVASYVWTVNYFLSHYGEVNKKNLLPIRAIWWENFKPQTVNLRLQGINKYLGVYQARQVESEVCQSAAKELLRECHQRCRL